MNKKKVEDDYFILLSLIIQDLQMNQNWADSGLPKDLINIAVGLV